MGREESSGSTQVKQAVILAAGKGEQLYPLTSLKPKVMLPISNKPILQYVIEALVTNSIKDIIIVVGYYREQVQDYFGSGKRFGAQIRYTTQDHQLGTGHALLCAKGMTQDKFLVLPGDNIITSATIQELVCATQNTVLISRWHWPGFGDARYGAVLIHKGQVHSFLGKPPELDGSWINTGTYLLNDSIFDHLPGELELPLAIESMIHSGSIFAPQQTSLPAWWDAVRPWDLLRLNGLVLGQLREEFEGTREPSVVIKGNVQIAKTSVIRANSYILGPVVIGEGCEIGPSVVIYPCTSIGNNVMIDSFTQLRNCILGNSIQIGSHTHMSSTIVADGCTLGPRLTAPDGKVIFSQMPPIIDNVGAIIGDNAEIGANVTMRPGLLVGPEAQIREMNQIRENVPAGSVVV
jgi:UDP-N-acetylglucosamine diphosphorylase/glucosamine-1-phosphate N-acetyltransferase